MARLLFATLASLDGYIADPEGNFDWAAPGEQVHAFVNDLMRSVGTHLYGRRTYDVMRYWDAPPASEWSPPAVRDFAAIWQAADKVVYSRTLPEVSDRRARIERDFRPEQIRELKEGAVADLAIGGPELAAHAFRAGLVDDCHLFVVPWLVGGGTRAFPEGLREPLRLADQRRFDDGTVYLHYQLHPRAGG